MVAATCSRLPTQLGRMGLSHWKQVRLCRIRLTPSCRPCEHRACITAGSGIGAITRLLELHPDVFTSESSSPNPEADVRITTAADVYARIRCVYYKVALVPPNVHPHTLRCYLITHAHLDHVNGLVLSAGSVQGPAKLVHGTKKSLEGVASIFSGDIWPKLASWQDAEVPGSSLLLSPYVPALPVSQLLLTFL